MRFVVLLTAAAGVIATAPSSETVAYLNSVMEDSEKQIFTEWARATIDQEVHVLVLERLSQMTPCTDADLLDYVTARHPNHFESLQSISGRHRNALLATSQPGWFHDALMRWPAPVAPPSDELLTYLESIRPAVDQPHLASRQALTRNVYLWEALCIEPLGTWTGGAGPAPCAPQTVTSPGKPATTKVYLANFQIRRYLAAQLLAARNRVL